MKKTSRILLVLALCLAVIASFAACSDTSEKAFQEWNDKYSTKLEEALKSFNDGVQSAAGDAAQLTTVYKTYLDIIKPAYSDLDKIDISKLVETDQQKAQEAQEAGKSLVANIENQITILEGADQSTAEGADQSTADDADQSTADDADQSTADDADQSTADDADQGTADDADQSTADDADQGTADDADQSVAE